MVDKLIIFFSSASACNRVAEVLSKELNADLFRVKTHGFGLFKPMSHRSRLKNDKPIVKLPNDLDLKKYKTIYIGGPIWDGTPAPALQDLVKQLNIKGKNVSLFLVSSDGFGISIEKFKELVKAEGAYIKGMMTFEFADSKEIILDKIRRHS